VEPMRNRYILVQDHENNLKLLHEYEKRNRETEEAVWINLSWVG